MENFVVCSWYIGFDSIRLRPSGWPGETMDVTVSGTHYLSAQGRMETLFETNHSSALPLMEVMEVETDQPLAPPKPNQPYRGGRYGPRGATFATVTLAGAIVIWAVLRYGSTLLNTTSNGGLTSSPTWMPTEIPSTKPTFTPTGPSAAPTPMPSLPSTGMSTTLPSSKLTSTPAGPSSAPIAKLSSIPTRLPTSAATIANFLLLDVTQLNDFSSANSWNITKVSHGKNFSLHKITDDPATHSGSVLQVNYPAGSYKPSAAIVGGIGVYASPAAIFPARSVQLSYEVFFSSNFDPIKGGKLPGLYIGPPGAAGGNHLNNEASCRIMWRKNNLIGGFTAEAYVYINKTQDPSYYQIPGLKLDPVDGDSVWRGLVNFKKGSWNKIEMILTANTITGGLANADGFLNLTINSVSQTFDKFIYTTTASAINGITFTTFFGGSDVSWATLVATSSYFKNVFVKKLS